MNKDVVVPEVGESISRGLLSQWLKKEGEYVNEGEELFELETDKTTLAVPATASGVLKVKAQNGVEVEVGQVVGAIDTGAKKPALKKEEQPSPEIPEKKEVKPRKTEEGRQTREGEEQRETEDLSPAVRRIVVENRLDPSLIQGTGKDGRITKADALKAIDDKKQTSTTPPITDALKAVENKKQPSATPPGKDALKAVQSKREPTSAPPQTAKEKKEPVQDGTERKSRVKMTGIRKKIAENLVLSKQTAAHLTTFNEIDMNEIIETRKSFGEEFEKKHGVRLGYMSFFIKACQNALETYPEVNASIEGDEIVYNNFYDIAVALSTDRGLITPVIRDVEHKGFAQIEEEILLFRKRAEEKKLTPDELMGATFTITNGGVFGSLLSTPIPSPGQTGILGMHAIQKRPVVVNDEITIKPMMYVALTYDHRLVDGREAIGFLLHIKKSIEDPQRLCLDL
jgi:2-oxoglutarate dehydrogenase E2 component (dihydrolipoamide succinyltransferase)